MTGGPKRIRRPEAAKGRPPRLDILVEAGDWPPRSTLRGAASRAIRAATAQAGAEVPADAELSLVFTDDAHISALNARFRGMDRPTNVLSFPSARQAGRFQQFLGDIVLAHETIRREAEDQGLIFDHHLTHLIVHGFLHLLGFDHESEREAVVMERLETAILMGIGIADPYASGGEGDT
jgi:probable rRNA maturation factor